MAARPMQEPIATGGRISVLVVEDDSDHAELIRRSLEHHAVDVTVVADGPSCLDAVAAASYSLIMLDYGLPRMNGLEVLDALRAHGTACPVVMITAQGDEKLACDALTAGGIDFIPKTAGYLTALPTVLFKALKQHELARENARLHQETRRQLRNAEALIGLDRALSSTLALKPLLETIGRAVAQACDAARCLLLLCEEKRVRPAAWQSADGRMDDRLGQLIPLDGAAVDELPFVAETIERRHPIVIGDPAHDPRVPDALVQLGAGALLALPLMRQGTVIGVLVLDRRAGAPPFTASEILFGTAAASHVALALDNARLYEDTQRALADLQAAHDRLVRGETLRALGELAGGVAHHLNNLLAVVCGRTQLLLRSSETAAIRRPLEIIERAAADGAEVVRRIREFARVRSSEEHRALDLNRIVEDVVEMGRARWHDAALANGVTIEVVRELGPVPPVRGHAAALREAVMNLLLNAVDAMPRGGRITLRTGHDESGAFLAVCDTGVGMPADVLERAHEPFFTTKGVESMGLGLSVTFGIVERQGGELAIESREGAGTVATIRLPLAAAADEDSHPGAFGPRSAAILLVDDDPAVREALAELLDADGHRVVPAPGPHEALMLLEHGLDVDLVLTDLAMPAMTGWDLARAVKSRWPRLRVAVLTGWNEVSNNERRDGVDFVVSKPLDLAAFRAAAVGAGAAGAPSAERREPR
jgi:signal transduction histidine kinase/DNA-binding response OmpR family regulator